VAATRTEDGHK